MMKFTISYYLNLCYDFLKDVKTMIDYINNTKIFKDGAVETLISSIFIIVFSLIVSKLLDIYIKKHVKNNQKIVLRIKNACIWIIAFYGIFNKFNAFSDILTTIAASTGVLTLAISLATQDAIGEFVNGVMIYTFRPFTINDTIKLTDYNIVGRVLDISMRHTVIKTPENTELIIPNSIMNKAILENVSNVDDKKANFLELDISYDSDIDLAFKIIEEEVTSHPFFVDPRSEEEKAEGKKPLTIRLDNFLDSSMHIKVILYSKNSAHGVSMLSDLRIAIKKRFDDEGVEMPYPHTVVEIKK